MKKIIKIAIIIFLHSTFCAKDNESRESKKSLLLRGVKTVTTAAAVGAAGAIGLKHLAKKSNLASKVTIQPFNKIFQKLEQNSIKNVGFSGALLAAGLYGTYKYFKNKKSRQSPRKGERFKGNTVIPSNAQGASVPGASVPGQLVYAAYTPEGQQGNTQVVQGSIEGDGNGLQDGATDKALNEALSNGTVTMYTNDKNAQESPQLNTERQETGNIEIKGPVGPAPAGSVPAQKNATKGGE